MRAAVACLAAAVALPGCGGGGLPAVSVTAVPTAAAAACERFHTALPEDLGDELSRRDTVPGDPHVAAYGEPPIVIRCGAPATKAYEPGDPLFQVNGVDWFAEERPEAVIWSLPRAFTNVEVTVPRAWTGDRLAYLAGAVKAMG